MTLRIYTSVLIHSKLAFLVHILCVCVCLIYQRHATLGFGLLWFEQRIWGLVRVCGQCLTHDHMYNCGKLIEPTNIRCGTLFNLVITIYTENKRFIGNVCGWGGGKISVKRSGSLPITVGFQEQLCFSCFLENIQQSETTWGALIEKKSKLNKQTELMCDLIEHCLAIRK